MNPTMIKGAQPRETMPLQGYSPNPGHPGNTAPALVQYTMVNVPDDAPSRDHVVWSLLCFIYGNPCCLGLAALICSIKSRDRKVVGDVEGARQHASTARCLNIAATIITVLSFLISIISFSVIVGQT